MFAIVLSKDTNWESQCTADKFIPCYSAVEWDVCVCGVCVCYTERASIHSPQWQWDTHWCEVISPQGVLQRENNSKEKDMQEESRI